MSKTQHIIDCIAGYMYGGAVAVGEYPDPGTSPRMSLRAAISSGVTTWYHGLRNGTAGDWASGLSDQLEAEDRCWLTLSDPKLAEQFGREVTLETMRVSNTEEWTENTIYDIIIGKAPSKEFGEQYYKNLMASATNDSDVSRLRGQYMVGHMVPVLMSNGYNEVAMGLLAATGMTVTTTLGGCNENTA